MLLSARSRQVLRRPIAARPAGAMRACVRNQHRRAALPELIASIAEAAPGDVDAPIGVIVGAAIVVTLAATALVPLALSPGQNAADKIFAETRTSRADPLSKKKTSVKSKRR